MPTTPAIATNDPYVSTRPTERDSKWEKPESYNAFERFWLERLRDERDLTMIYAAAVRTLLLFPAVAGLYAWGDFPWWVGGAYVGIVFATLLGRYLLMLHCVGHRALFKREYRSWNHYIPVVLGPFFGQTPYTYYSHHMGVHHPENNLFDDLSTTMGYRRDSFPQFLMYWADFFFVNWIKVPLYLKRKKRTKLMKLFLYGEAGWYLTMGVLLYLAPWPTFWVFVLPFLLIRWFMMCGNWAQHAFVDPKDPNNPLLNSVTLTNCPLNTISFNDGYHAVHHAKPSLHWSEMPGEYERNWRAYAESQAIVFDGVADFVVLWFHVMTKRYDYLATKLVDFPGYERTHEEKVALLRSRVEPIERVQWNHTPSAARRHAKQQSGLAAK